MLGNCQTSNLGGDDLNLSKLVLGEREAESAYHQDKLAELEPESPNEGRDAETILPPEFIWATQIWEQILLELAQPPDIHSCHNTCQLWRTILRGSQFIWCFRSIFPSVFPYLDKTDILNCRASCKYWTEAVDTTLENHEALRPLTGNAEARYGNCYHKSALASTSTSWLRKWKELTSSYKLIRRNRPTGWDEDFDEEDDEDPDEYLVQSMRWYQFQYGLKSHPKNPLLGRSLSVEVDLRVIFRFHRVWDELLDLFSHVGRHLLYFDIRFRDNPSFGIGAETSYIWLLHFLKETPYLRKLCFWYPRSKTGNLKNLLFMQNHIPRTKFPALDNLETLELAESGTEIIFDLAILKEYSDQLGKLQVDHWLPEYSKFSWSNLADLNVEQIWSDEHLLSFLDLDCPKLRKLSINLNTKGQKQFRKLLEIANRFPTLLYFHFSLDYLCPRVIPEDVLEFPADLRAPPSLKVLGVGHSHKIYYDFLPRFKSIQCLHLVNSSVGMRDEEDKTDVVEQVKVHGPLEKGNMQESNIWQVLPNLKHISFRETENSPIKTSHWERRIDER